MSITQNLGAGRGLLAAITVGMAVSGCVSVPREPAVELAKAGQKTATASQASLKGVADDVGKITERNLVRFAVTTCTPAACQPRRLDAASRPADDANTKLANVILLRVKAIQQLNDAYAAFQAEGEYDAAGALDTALSDLTSSANALSAAVTAATGTALPFMALAPIIQKAAGESAKAAQRRRLMNASERLRAVDLRLIETLQAEQAAFRSIGGSLVSNKANVADLLLDAGLADPTPMLTEFNTGLGLTTPAKLNPADPKAVVAARTLVAYRAEKTVAAADGSYAANIKALRKLVEQHDKFEAKQALDLDAIAGAIDELKGWAEIIAALNDTATKGATP